MPRHVATFAETLRHEWGGGQHPKWLILQTSRGPLTEVGFRENFPIFLPFLDGFDEKTEDFVFSFRRWRARSAPGENFDTL